MILIPLEESFFCEGYVPVLIIKDEHFINLPNMYLSVL